MMLAVFFAMTQGKSVALVGMNSNGCFGQADVIRSNLDKHNNKIFKKRVSIYKQADEEVITQIVSDGYDYVIIDFGHEYEANRQTFLLCNVKLIIGNLSWWKLQFYVAFVAKTENEGSRGKWLYYGNNVTKKAFDYMKKRLGLVIYAIPYEADPYYLSENGMQFLTELSNLMEK